MDQIGQVLAFHHTQVFQARHSVVAELRGSFSTAENQPSKREKSKGYCSRVSTMMLARGVLSCVPPRSAKTGIKGGATGASAKCQVSGDFISVGARLFIISSLGCSLLPGILVMKPAENGTGDYFGFLRRAVAPHPTSLGTRTYFIGNSGSKTAVWAPGIVVANPFP